MRRVPLLPLLALALKLAEGKDKLKSVTVDPGQIVLSGKWATQRIQGMASWKVEAALT